MLNLTSTAKESLHNESKMDTLIERQSSLTCVSSSSPVQPSSIEELRMWLVEAFPASLSPLPESKQAQTMPEICGLQQPTLFASSDLPAFSWKTYQDYSNSTTPKVFSLTLPKWGMWDDTGLYPQPMWEPGISESDCGSLESWATPRANSAMASAITADSAWDEKRFPNLETQVGMKTWATPNTMDSLPAKSPEALEREATIARPGRTNPANLRDQVSNGKNWPSPTCSDVYTGNLKSTQQKPGSMHSVTLPQAVAMWPTPTSHLAKETGAPSEYDRNEPSISSRVFNGDERNGMALNPDWVCWLMGFPIGWDDVKPLAELNWRDWQTDPADTGEISRVTDIKLNRANRLKALGNAQVPQCVVKAWELLS